MGCGNGAKLAALHPRFEVIGIDLPGPNLDACRERYPELEWLAHDVETTLPLPVDDAVLSRSVIVCSDVIEHLRRPERLLRTLRWDLEVARAVVLSTPERDLTWGPEHAGPPPNPCHVREWSTAELDALLADVGFRYRALTLTRSNDRQADRKTILCRLFADPTSRDAVVALDRP